jgi:hypothetical protein
MMQQMNGGIWVPEMNKTKPFHLIFASIISKFQTRARVCVVIPEQTAVVTLR